MPRSSILLHSTVHVHLMETLLRRNRGFPCRRTSPPEVILYRRTLHFDNWGCLLLVKEVDLGVDKVHVLLEN